jgi:hypothetical protein
MLGVVLVYSIVVRVEGRDGKHEIGSICLVHQHASQCKSYFGSNHNHLALGQLSRHTNVPGR